MIDLSVLTTIGAIVFIVVFFIYSKIQLAKQHEKIKKINGSIIFSVWPGTQTSAFSDLKIA